MNGKGLSRSEEVRVVGPYLLQGTLGKGQTGLVKLGVHCKTKKTVAVKIIDRSHVSESVLRKVEREIAIMKLIEHPYLLGLYDVYDNNKYLFLILEHIKGGELFDYLVSKGRLSYREARRFFRQIVSAIDYCHAHCVCHRDLKPENLLLDEHKNIRVADFGMANLQGPEDYLETSCGSPHYACPEVIRGDRYDGRKADVWSCGVILYALVVGALPFDDDNIRKLLEKVKTGKFYMPDGLPRDLQKLISGMLHTNPDMRLTLSEVNRNPWMTASQTELELEVPAVQVVQTFPIDSTDAIDPDVFTSMRSLGCFKDKEQLIPSLLSPEHNIEKVIYFLLMRRKINNPSVSDDEDLPDSERNKEADPPRKRKDSLTLPLTNDRTSVIVAQRRARAWSDYSPKLPPQRAKTQPYNLGQAPPSPSTPHRPSSGRRGSSPAVVHGSNMRRPSSPAVLTFTPPISVGGSSSPSTSNLQISTPIGTAGSPPPSGQQSVSSPSPCESPPDSPSMWKRRFKFMSINFGSPRFHRRKLEHVAAGLENEVTTPQDTHSIKRSWFSNILHGDREEIFLVVHDKQLHPLKADIVRALLSLHVTHQVVSPTSFIVLLNYQGKRKFSKARRILKMMLEIGLCEGEETFAQSTSHTISMKLMSGSSRRFKRLAERIQSQIVHPLDSLIEKEDELSHSGDEDEEIVITNGDEVDHPVVPQRKSSSRRRKTISSIPARLQPFDDDELDTDDDLISPAASPDPCRRDRENRVRLQSAS